ncbi:hypothetical protein CYMTET_36660 [Cymbomonas tetramitiformis]|uniref:Uncharacterized protein n=1 Tax=Cymbomonas tetramitiformis TaxID=36881 RepID=A0AAE0CHR3_9CHLO|nr:hypothetical protein CYMTET_36660 [Cymbomonas tetramitiformis]
MVIFWVMSVWITITCATLVREMLGKEAEHDILIQWVMAMLADNLFFQVLKAVTISQGLKAIMIRIRDRSDREGSVIAWYEEYISRHLNLKFMRDREDAYDIEYDALGIF